MHASYDIAGSNPAISIKLVITYVVAFYYGKKEPQCGSYACNFNSSASVRT
ncbi:hypothetical protein HMPREF9318_00081 [Streptococcus urinalis FB127-CNA-2]|uniref:Uncharacterized protein n=1 Tax=Streptococcus urinalis 2285-97 TaxID=764291 RepID=G5KEI5_9STRE|nr:hypothetical protein STRUR_0819 [Streptococcus urinalis 2285-97]EKS21883.1 hypothetical protein HMPREF9318_00081 [Streptococcus urinalis FB127-CNA-2]QBX22143.1 hypothetical protein Javan637_0035 [Streptococcus phage Javan637]QBX31599.1 hypothetical protein Javan642_0035 [Streptococcus phage Javan642]QBX31656.1 hypothetical protein Javan648_0030 [Streptococcus phage Javan648]VEF31696.1 Uncharacterised protein [Streptococcus urinalis]